MSTEIRTEIINLLAESLDIPDSAYEAAAARYRDLGTWLHDTSKARSSQYSPKVSAQGSFRLGTVVKPIQGEEYDLDLGCCLCVGLSKSSISQQELKELLGKDLDAYREERGIDEEVEAKHRCWRLHYQDHLKFHMDVVPSIPAANSTRQLLTESIIRAGTDQSIAPVVAVLAVSITDDRHPTYCEISNDWLVSNTEGYARWFEWRMQQAQQFLRSRAIMEKVSKIEELPTYKWRTPLQRTIQILKRHRDVMFKNNPESKPISAIITTLAARAYAGEPDVKVALENVLKNMGHLVSKSRPRVANPANPQEDFAERWGSEEGQRLRLEEHFWLWLKQAQTDFQIVTTSQDKEFIAEETGRRYGVKLDKRALDEILGAGVTAATTIPRLHQISNAPRPWRK